MAKFKCKSCKKIHTITSYSSVVRNEKVVQVDSKTKKEFLCDCNKKTQLEMIEEKIDGFCTNFGKFASSSQKDKAKILKERSTKHFKKEIAEVKRDMIKRDDI